MQTYGRHAFWGLAWVSASLIATKLSSFIAHLFLGWLLLPDDYKIWGMVLALNVFVDGLLNGGFGKIMQQRGVSALDDAAMYFKYGLVFNALSVCMLLVLIPLSAAYFENDNLTWLILLKALSILLQTPGELHKTRLLINLKFSTIAKTTTICSVVVYSSMIGFAAMGMGPYSFSLPIVLAALLEWGLYRTAAGALTSSSRLQYEDFRQILRSSKWIMLSATFITVTMVGDYMVIGRMAPDLLGEYVFGFNLTIAFSMIFATGISQVLLPTFSQLKDDRKRLGDAFRKSVTLTAMFCSPCCAAIAVFAPFIVHFLWNGKWDAASAVVQVMSLCFILRLFNPLAASALQAVARWDVLAKALFLDAGAVLFGAWAGSLVGGLTAIAIGVGLGKCVAVPVVLALASSAVRQSWWQLLRETFCRIWPPMFAVVAVWLVFGFPGDLSSGYLAKAALSLLVSVAGLLWYYRDDLQLVREFTQRRSLSEDLRTAGDNSS